MLTKEELEAGLNSWLSGEMLTNALSVIDKVVECQEKYKVNAVFMYALMRDETGIGIANTDWVAEKNWCSLTSYGHKDWGTPQANIEQCAWKINGGEGLYFAKGDYTVHEVGATFCAEPPPPVWGDNVQKFMVELYEAAGIDLSQFMGGDILEVAFQCMQWLDEHNCTYVLGGGHVPMTDADTSIDCTRYTSWVLYLAGYLPEPVIYTSYDLETNPLNWEKITNKADLQPGDILVYNNHADIYVGPGSDGSNESTIVKYNAGWETWKAYSPTYKYESGWREGYLFALRPAK